MTPLAPGDGVIRVVYEAMAALLVAEMILALPSEARKDWPVELTTLLTEAILSSVDSKEYPSVISLVLGFMLKLLRPSAAFITGE